MNTIPRVLWVLLLSILLSGCMTAVSKAQTPSHVDGQPFNFGQERTAPIGCAIDDTSTITYSDDSGRVIRCSQFGDVNINLRDSTGTSLGTLANPLVVELNGPLRDGQGNSVADDTNHAIRVNVVAGAAAGGTSSTIGSAVPGAGTLAGYRDTSGNMRDARVYDLDTGAGTENSLGVVLRKSASGGSVEIGTATDPVRVDPTGTTTQPVTVKDSGGADATDTTNHAIKVNVVAGGGAGGTSSTFGAAFPGPGTAVGFSDGTNMRPGFALDADTGGGVQYMQGINLRRTASGGSTELLGQTTMALSLPVVLPSDQIVTVGGNIAHDSADAGGPVKVGGRARTSDITAVANDDRVDAQFDTLGVQIARRQRPDALVSGCGNSGGTTDTSVIAAQGAGTHIYLTDYSTLNRSTTNVMVTFKSAATAKWEVTNPANYGGAVMALQSPIRLGDNEAAQYANSATPSGGSADTRVCFAGYVASN